VHPQDAQLCKVQHALLDCGFGIADLVLTNKTFELTPFAQIFPYHVLAELF
jgi:hypothetical protein